MKNLFLTTAAIVALTLPALAYSADYTAPANDPAYNSPSDTMNNDMMNDNGAMNGDNYRDDNNHSSAGATTSGPPRNTSSMNGMPNERYVTRSEFMSQGHTRREFNCLDKNHDGRLSQTELSADEACYTNNNQ